MSGMMIVGVRADLEDRGRGVEEFGGEIPLFVRNDNE
jgi:hypothetical protein